MKTLVKCKEHVIKCNFCGAVYRLETPKDYQKIRTRKSQITLYYVPRFYMTCKCCKHNINVEGVK